MTKNLVRTGIFISLFLVWHGVVLAQNGNAQKVGEALLEQLRTMAETGNLDAQFRLGELYEQGEIVERDLTKAVEAYQQAAEQGHAGAQYALAHIYHLGNGVEQDMATAMIWYSRAARQGNVASQLALGDQYRIGLAVPRDLGRSTMWYRRAADRGNIFAEYELGNAYRYGNGVAPDPAQAIKWYRRSAEAGNPSAQLALAELECGDTEAVRISTTDKLSLIAAAPQIRDAAEAPDVADWTAAGDRLDVHPETFESAMATVAEEKAAIKLPRSETSWLKSPPTTVPATKPAAATLSNEASTVSEMLKRAKYQIATLALTTPGGDNAYETYQRVLLIEPDNAAALDGIEEIGLKYAELANRAAAKGDLKNSRKYAAKASVLAPDRPLVQSLSMPHEAEPSTPEPERLAQDQAAQAQMAKKQPIDFQLAKQQVAEAAVAREQEGELEIASNPSGPRHTKTSGVQHTGNTRARNTRKDLMEDVDDIIFRPYADQDREVVVAGSVVRFFWNYQLIADDGRSNIVIDVNELKDRDRAKLDDAFDKAGFFDPVRVRIRGKFERHGFATYKLAATELKLTASDFAEGSEDADLQGGHEGIGDVVLSVGSVDSTDLNFRQRRDNAGGGRGGGNDGSPSGASDGTDGGGNGGSPSGSSSGNGGGGSVGRNGDRSESNAGLSSGGGGNVGRNGDRSESNAGRSSGGGGSVGRNGDRS